MEILSASGYDSSVAGAYQINIAYYVHEVKPTFYKSTSADLRTWNFQK